VFAEASGVFWRGLEPSGHPSFKLCVASGPRQNYGKIRTPAVLKMQVAILKRTASQNFVSDGQARRLMVVALQGKVDG
jgi:hypothetical protein